MLFCFAVGAVWAQAPAQNAATDVGDHKLNVRVTGTAKPGVPTVVFAAAQPVGAHWPSSALVSIDVYDRNEGTSLVVYPKDGRRYIIGAPGHEYAVRIRNNTGERILAVTSVDGVNVVSGETASPEQSGYVLDAYGGRHPMT